MSSKRDFIGRQINFLLNSTLNRLTSHGVTRLVELIHQSYYSAGVEAVGGVRNASSLSVEEVTKAAEKRIYPSGEFNKAASRDYLYITNALKI